MSVSKEQNAAQRLSSKYKSPPIGCIENIEHKGKDFSRRNVGNSVYLLMMMMDDSTITHERQIDCLNMKRLENQFCLIYFSRSRSTLMRKCVAEQILANWLKTFLTYLEIYSLDVEVIMEVELNELKHFGSVLFEGSQEKQLIELSECRTLVMKFAIIGKIETSNEKMVLWKYFVVFLNMWKTTLRSAKWVMG